MNGPTSNASITLNSTTKTYYANFSNIINRRSCYARLYVLNDANTSKNLLKIK